MSLLIRLRNDEHYSIYVNPRMITSVTPRDRKGAKITTSDETLYVQEDPNEVASLCEAALARE